MHDSTLETVRSVLDMDAIEAAYEDARVLTLDEAVAYALHADVDCESRGEEFALEAVAVD